MDKINMKKVMKYDGYIRMALGNGIIFLGMSIYFSLSQVDVGVVLYVFYAFTAIALLLFLWRLFYLSRFGVDLLLVKAEVIRIFYNRGVKTLTCSYIVDGVTYKKRYSVNYTKATRDYKKEDLVDIVVQKDTPKRSLIRDLYFD